MECNFMRVSLMSALQQQATGFQFPFPGVSQKLLMRHSLP
jgi:hypothetical protein